jgi:carboxyl-terminal processing protease
MAFRSRWAVVLLAQGTDMSPAAREYLTKALDFIQTNALTSDRVDWPAVRARAFEQASRAQSSADTYDAIRTAIAALGDRHSSFLTPASDAALEQAATPPPPSGSIVDGRLAHVIVPAFLNRDRAGVAGYATALQAVLRSLDSPATCGWIVDLRQNFGGNMWPMLAGIGPLLSPGTLGAFAARGGESAAWTYENGAALRGSDRANWRCRTIRTGCVGPLRRLPC